ncbi:hypothetical protein TYRP_005191 [Tyrophagus putrescentiae]|nr:hypothetical protein TYRP_005191 [Tyrophagus putrescentiae]
MATTSTGEYVYQRWLDNPEVQATTVFSDYNQLYGSLAGDNRTESAEHEEPELCDNDKSKYLNQSKPKTISNVNANTSPTPVRSNFEASTGPDDDFNFVGFKSGVTIEKVNSEDDDSDGSEDDQEDEEECFSENESVNFYAPTSTEAIVARLPSSVRRAFVLQYFLISSANILQCIKGELRVEVLADNVGNE